jgi:hypothetical protein
MSRDEWRGALEAYASILIVSIILMCGLAVYSSNPIQHEQHQQQAATHCTENGCAGSGADERIAVYTWWLAWFTFALAVSTVGLWIVTWRDSDTQASDTQESLRLTREAAASSERALHVSERPWLAVDLSLDTRGLVFGKPDSVRLMVNVDLTNAGRSPAVDIEIELAFCGRQSIASERLRELCVAAREMREGRNIRLCKAVYPKFSLPEPVLIPLTINADEMLAAMAATGNDIIIPSVIGCVTYRSPFSEERVQTGLIYDLSRVEPLTGQQTLFHSTPKGILTAFSLPAKHLRFEESFTRGVIS